MKVLAKPILVVVILLMGASLVSVNAQTKVAHINSTELLEAMPEKAQMTTALQSFQKKLEQKLITMQQELQQKYQTFQQQEHLMTEAIKQSNIKDIQDLELRIQEFQIMANQELEAEQQRIQKPIIDKVRKAIADVATEKGYDYVLDTGTGVVLFDGGGDDIMPLVKKKLGIL